MLVGTGGKLNWNGMSGEFVLWRGDAKAELVRPPAGFARNDPFLSEMRHFLACCAGDALPRCTLQDGIRALELALSAGTVPDEYTS